MRKVDWSQARCRETDPEVFFTPALEDVARAICWSCTIRQECLIIALERPERYGVWGGHTDEQRRRFRYRKTRVRCPACSSTDVDQSLGTTELCRSCALSWRV